MNFDSVFKRHNFGVLHFSGGKDSLACLYMLRPYWSQIIVMWCNTGSAFPETISQMEQIRSIVPHFIEVKSEQQSDIEENGIPVDILPHTNTDHAHIFGGSASHKMRIFYDCCKNNIWVPMHEATAKTGATLIIRGQKLSDKNKSPALSGHVCNGVEYLFPLEMMSDDEVYWYLSENNIQLPANYEYINTSLDCWNCTAYIFENAKKLEYMRMFHPEKADIVADMLSNIFDDSVSVLRVIASSLDINVTMNKEHGDICPL